MSVFNSILLNHVESEETAFRSTAKATKDNRSHVNDLIKQNAVSGVAPSATPQEANVPEAESNVQCTLDFCDVKNNTVWY